MVDQKKVQEAPGIKLLLEGIGEDTDILRRTMMKETPEPDRGSRMYDKRSAAVWIRMQLDGKKNLSKVGNSQ